MALPDVGPRVMLALESGGGVGEVGTGDRRLRERYAAAGDRNPRTGTLTSAAERGIELIAVCGDERADEGGQGGRGNAEGLGEAAHVHRRVVGIKCGDQLCYYVR